MIITSGIYKGQKIIAPDENITRPTLSKIRMSVFNTLNSIIDFDDKNFLDMFAGSGIIGLEAISRGFKSALAIEKNPKVFNVLKNNFKKFPKSPKLLFKDSVKAVKNLDEKFDVIYIDPPYNIEIYDEILNSIKHIAKNIIVIEHTKDIEFFGFEVIKQKKYGDKFITFLRLKDDL